MKKVVVKEAVAEENLAEEVLPEKKTPRISRRLLAAIIAAFVLVVVAVGGVIWLHLSRSVSDIKNVGVVFDVSLTAEERMEIEAALSGQDIENVMIAVEDRTDLAEVDDYLVWDAEVPVASFYDSVTEVTMPDLVRLSAEGQLTSVKDLNVAQKVLAVEGDYYFDDFEHGAILRVLRFSGDDAGRTRDILREKLDVAPTKDEIFSFTQTGVTALARKMISKLTAVGGDATYFSAKIGETLRAADITHISNEVSFYDDCKFVSNTAMSFCSPWAMLAAIADSGIDVVELTGNHNNDYGAAANTNTINKYHELGMKTFGGGLNTEEAGKPYEVEMRGSSVVVLGYNAADGPGSGAVAGANRAGANIFTYAKAKEDIEAAKAKGAFVIVDIQYSECYSYPERGTEMPACDYPIQGQQAMFREMAKYGADMVVGTSAHQPQTFEIWQGVPIFYGLGNLWFDQDAWPGTSRGLVLTHYFYNGRLLSSRVQPTIYDSALQVDLMAQDKAENFLERLGRARPKDADRLEPQTVQEVVDEWATGRDVGVAVYDLDHKQLVAVHNQLEKYFSASLYKLAVVSAGYLKVQDGQDPNAVLTGGHTWGECLDAAIRSSDSPCAEALWAKVGQDKATTSMSASDVIRELIFIWGGDADGGENLSEESRAKYLDSMLNQDALYRRGLPSGFLTDVKVYNKVGWNGTHEWHDAAIVSISGRHYAVAVMSDGLVPNAMGFSAVKDLGTRLQRTF
jgi:hypothetical protein